jgi:predicted MFS family arabinose efflux permease
MIPTPPTPPTPPPTTTTTITAPTTRCEAGQTACGQGPGLCIPLVVVGVVGVVGVVVVGNTAVDHVSARISAVLHIFSFYVCLVSLSLTAQQAYINWYIPVLIAILGKERFPIGRRITAVVDKLVVFGH